MTPEEKQHTDLLCTRLENDLDLFEQELDEFRQFLIKLAQLSRLIRAAFLESRIWEELEEYRKNDGNKTRPTRFKPGYDVKSKPRRTQS